VVLSAALPRVPTNRKVVMAECNLCHQDLVECYGAAVESVRHGDVILAVSLSGLHHECARDWVEAERSRQERGDDADLGVISRVAVEH
jgi:hypothetical protein